MDDESALVKTENDGHSDIDSFIVGGTRNVIIEKLEAIEQGIKLKKELVTATVQIWEILSSNVTESSYSNYVDLFPRIVRALARTIFSSPWIKLSKKYGSTLLEYVKTLQEVFTKLDLTHELAQLQTIIFLFENNRWSYPEFNHIIKTKEQITDEIVAGLWKVEGWNFIESRLEQLCISIATPVIRLGEAFLYKGKQFLEYDNNVMCQDSKHNPFSDLTPDKYIQQAALVAVYITHKKVEVPDSEDFSYQMFNTHLSPTYLLKLIDFLLNDNSQAKYLDGWDLWTIRHEEAGFSLLNSEIEHLMEYPELSFEDKKSLLNMWLSLSLDRSRKTKENANEQDNLISKSIDEIMPDNINSILQKVISDAHAFELAESLVKLHKDSSKMLLNCIDIYLQRLEPEVERLVSVRDIGDKDAEIEISKQLAPTFLSLWKHINSSVQISFEVLLTIFSLDPTQENLNELCNLYESNANSIEINGRLTRTYNSQLSTPLPDPLFMKLTSVIETARLCRLSVYRDNWEKLNQVLHKHLETRGKDIKSVKELHLAKPTDFSLFKELGPAFDEDDTGFEAGYLPNSESEVEKEVEDEEEKEEINDAGKKKRKVKKKKNILKEPNHRMQNFLRNKRIASTVQNLRNIKQMQNITRDIKPEGVKVRRKYVRKLDTKNVSKFSRIQKGSNIVSSPKRKPGRPSLFSGHYPKCWPPLHLCQLRGNLQYYPVKSPNFPKNFGISPTARALDVYFAFPSTYAAVCRPIRFRPITKSEIADSASKSQYSPSFDIFNAPAPIINQEQDYSNDPNDWISYGMNVVGNENLSKLVHHNTIKTEQICAQSPRKHNPFLPELPKSSTSTEKEPLVLLQDIAERIVYNGKNHPLTPPDQELILCENERAVVKLHDIVRDGCCKIENGKVEFSCSRLTMVPNFKNRMGKPLALSINGRMKISHKRRREVADDKPLYINKGTKVHDGQVVSEVVDCMDHMLNQLTNSKPFQLYQFHEERSLIPFEPSFLKSTSKTMKWQLREKKRLKIELIHPSTCRQNIDSIVFGEKFMPGPVFTELKYIQPIQFKETTVTPPSIAQCIKDGMYRIPLILPNVQG